MAGSLERQMGVVSATAFVRKIESGKLSQAKD
jgi:hypothetical protein